VVNQLPIAAVGVHDPQIGTGAKIECESNESNPAVGEPRRRIVMVHRVILGDIDLICAVRIHNKNLLDVGFSANESDFLSHPARFTRQPAVAELFKVIEEKARHLPRTASYIS
jgi:hypothetical protein